MLAVTAMLAVPALMLASCGNDDGGDEASGGDNGKIGLVFDIGGKGDKSFNDAASKGLNEAADELGYETKELEPDEGGQNRAELLESLASGGYNPVIGVGFLFADSVLETAQAHPDTTFAIVDNAYGPEDEAKTKNIKQLVFAEEQGSFLVGAAAAMKTKSDTIGFIGGVETDLIKKFEAGYEAGAKHVNPEIKIEAQYITQPPDFNGFDDPAKAKTIAKSMYDGGADIIFHAAGASGSGLFEAAVEARGDNENIWAIGVDSDQYKLVPEDQQKIMLTSMIKKVDVAVAGAITDFDNGSTEGGVTSFDLEAGGVDYSTSGGFVDDISGDIDKLKEQIISGEIEVPITPQG
ncbi:MAG: BMP family ABC transporter substrate-binding protein [Candidatus Microthrix sp.]|nr:BMP family ABC transporter substrate-binding protein [Candidatus Microthrix sp.]